MFRSIEKAVHIDIDFWQDVIHVYICIYQDHIGVRKALEIISISNAIISHIIICKCIISLELTVSYNKKNVQHNAY